MVIIDDENLTDSHNYDCENCLYDELGSPAVSGPRGNAKLAPALTQATFVERVLTQQLR